MIWDVATEQRIMIKNKDRTCCPLALNFKPSMSCQCHMFILGGYLRDSGIILRSLLSDKNCHCTA